MGAYDDFSALFTKWNRGPLKSYLVEITAKILAAKESDGTYTLDHILDAAGQKGTGKWTANSALDLGVPLTLIAEAVFARCLSALKEERVALFRLYPVKKAPFTGEKAAFLKQLEEGLYLAKILSYTQGFMLLREAAKVYGWDLNYGQIALIWRAGCIIRSEFLCNIKEAFDRKRDLQSLLFDPFFKAAVAKGEESLRSIVQLGARHAIALPCFGAALSFFDGYRTERLPANLLQAQRDYFGAHTYERIDKPRGEFFHTNWSGTAGSATAGSYSV